MYSTLVTFFVYSHYIESANILGVFPFPSSSHQIVFQSLWSELSMRGHQVTVITPSPLNNPLLTNLTEINTEETYELLQGNKLENIGSKDGNVFQTLTTSLHLLDIVIEMELNNKEVQKLISDKNKTFDLILAECYFPVLPLLTGRYKAPVISLCSVAALTPHYTTIGSPNHPVLYPDFYVNSPTENLSFLKKVRNVLFSMWSMFHYFYGSVPRAHKMAEKYFSYLENIESNVNMMYVNENLFLYPPRPHVPGIIQMSQVHLKPSKTYRKLWTKAKEGVVYFSLGTNVKSIYLDKNLRSVITEALSELPYRVIWKWEADFLPNKPPNVVIREWLPQQDILAHPNLRVFVTQGGVQSIEEAIDREVPIVGLPFMYDQPTNMQKMVALGIGLTLDPATLTKDELKNAIIDVAENTIYKKQIKTIRKILLDKHEKSVENAIWWSEYVIRHKGAKHLRSSNNEISFFQYFILDVACVFIIFLMVVIYGSCKVIKLIKM